MGPAGAGSLAQVVNAAMANKARFDTMRAFFEGVGTGDTAGVWEDTRKTCARLPKKAPPRRPPRQGARKSDSRRGGC
jgi:phage tail tape-measure protein